MRAGVTSLRIALWQYQLRLIACHDGPKLSGSLLGEAKGVNGVFRLQPRHEAFSRDASVMTCLFGEIALPDS